MYKIKISETQLVRLCLDYLLFRGHYVWRNNTGVTHSTYTNKFGQTSDRMWRSGVPGSSDILGITKDGRFLAIECKIRPNKTTDIQERFLSEIKSRDGIAIVAYEVTDLEMVGL